MADPTVFGSAFLSGATPWPIEPPQSQAFHPPRSQLLQSPLLRALLHALTLHPSRTSAFGRLRFAFGDEQQDRPIDIRIQNRRKMQRLWVHSRTQRLTRYATVGTVPAPASVWTGMP